MREINVLDFQLANLIAAGEVVDRPGSVIKELVENAIDAGATTITVEIKRGGISFMRVTDNGKGMSPEDVPYCIKRHATSKIRTAADLDQIGTLGFRGEALAAISSVSKMTILTKQIENSMGTLLECEGPEVLEITETGCQNGTTILVEELFFNVPARRKFLKKDVSEGFYIYSVMERLAFSRPDIVFKYIADGALKFATPGSGKLLDTLYAVLGKDFADKTIPIDTREDRIHVHGYIGTPENTRGNTNLQVFFINHRFVKSKTAYAAIKQAFDSYIASDRFSCCVLFVDVDPRFVDVNVHPSKLEVKFSSEKLIFDVLYFAIRSALAKRINRPQGNFNVQASRVINAFVPVENTGLRRPAQLSINDMGPNVSSVIDETKKDDDTGSGSSGGYSNLDFVMPSIQLEPIHPDRVEDFSWDEIELPRRADRLDGALQPLPEYRIVGELYSSFIVVELKETVLFIDKHAAHERILFEDMKRNMQQSKVDSQILLLPVDILLGAEEFGAFCDYAEEIRKIGFDFLTNQDALSVQVTQIPTQIQEEKVTDFIQGMAGMLVHGATSVEVSKEILYEKALYQASCKAAVKAGRIYDDASANWICERVLVLPNIKYCPHGRPVAFEITKIELEKMFKRR
ncbi:MAG: DNA mismatch repair endonuclease MutL [Clostridiales bacterium]|nr:DNA mismatch repair endonuclease MutL [Clostridiales bacterium]